MRHGFHYTPCQRGSAVPVLLIVGGITSAVFWPTVVAVVTTVVLVLKLTLTAIATVTALAAAVAIGVAIRRHRPQAPGASVLAVQPARPAVEPTVAEQLAALSAAVERLAAQRQPALPAPARTVVIDQQALAALLAGLGRPAASDGPRELAGRWDAR